MKFSNLAHYYGIFLYMTSFITKKKFIISEKKQKNFQEDKLLQEASGVAGNPQSG